MAASGFTPIKLYSSSTAAAVPSAANLAAGELAINTADGKLFYKDTPGGVVQVIASKAGNVNVASFSAGTTGFTPSTATTGAVTLAGTLALANGGTAATSAPAAMASLTGFTTTVTTGLTTLLTNTSSFYQLFTGVLTHTVRLPVTSTLAQGWTFHICNNSTGNLTVNSSSGANLVITVLPGTTAMCTCILITGTTALSWEAGLTDFSTATGTGAVVLGTSPTISAATLTGDNTIQGMVVGRGPGASNVAFGIAVLLSNSSGAQNTAIGDYALIYNISGSQNTVLGYSALTDNTTGGNNIAVGYFSLAANDGDNNVAIGSPAMNSNTSGFNNTAVGYAALNGNTTGSFNTAIGSSSGGSGSYNVAVGASSGGTTGSYNVGIGYGVNYLGSSASYNIGIGNFALYSNTSGQDNVAVGREASYSGTGSSYNTAIGSYALTDNVTGQYNTGLGYKALFNNTSGFGNTAINPMTDAGSYLPVFDPTTQNNRFCMGSTAVTNAYIQVAWTVVSDARDKTDFAPVPHGLDFVSKLQPTAYRYKENRESTVGHGPVRYGFKAQDVLELEGNNSVIIDNEDGNKLRFNDQSLMAVLVNAIKELKVEFDEYKAAHP